MAGQHGARVGGPERRSVPAGLYRPVVRVVVVQLVAALAVAVAFALGRGRAAALAALAGGLIVACASALFGWRMFMPGIAGGARLATAMYAAVGLKWFWYLLALYVALALLKLDAGPLLAGLVVAQLGYWAALARFK